MDGRDEVQRGGGRCGRPFRLAEPTPVDPSAVGPEVEWLHLAVDAMDTGVVVLDGEGRIVFSNRAAQQMYAMSGEELRGRPSFDPERVTFRPDGSPYLAGEMPAARCLATGEVVAGSVVGVHSQRGVIEWHRADARPIHRDGELVGAILVFGDVTETIVMRNELHRSSQQLAEARRVGHVGLWEWDADSREVWCDEHYERITGAPFAGSLKGWLDGVDARDRRIVGDAMRRLRPGHPVEVVHRLAPGTDGGVRWVSAHAEVLAVGADGVPTKVAGSVVDVTEAKEAGEHLRRLLDSMGDGYYSLAPDWTFTFVNRRAEELLGRDDLVGRTVWEEFPGSEEILREHYEKALVGESIEVEVYYAGLDGWFEVRVYPMDSGIGVHFRNVTERRQQSEERERLLAEAADAQRRLARAALHDDLTDLPNRAALVEWMDDRSTGDRPRPMALLYLDLDRFKLVNDTYGHTTGDALLVQAARRLWRAVRPDDLVVRLGGDEFVVGISDTAAPEVRAIAERVVEAFRSPFAIGSRHVVVTTSVGVAASDGQLSAEALMSNADAALYRAKDAGRNQLASFDESLRASAWRRLATEADLRDALERSTATITAAFQPIFDLRTGQAIAAEALARWTHPTRGPVAPAQFIPIAEETGLIVDLGWVVLDAVKLALPTLSASFPPGEGKVWVNVAPRQLDEPGFARHLLDWVAGHDLKGRIGVEITESALSGAAAADASLRRMAAQGLSIAIDDFGTGFSSLSRLSRFPVDLLKIDRSFVAELGSTTGRGIVSSIVSLAHSIGATVCAEGVEEAWQVRVLRDLGVDSLSGFHLCRPTTVERFGADAGEGSARLRS